ncbi:MAG: HAD family hydrolase [Synergistaceae bacterium]|jgi:HAD superfamily hydrolase (TIGR01509 family)|nr:HAD family hydrolase [Synergistaceae bacterium]
MSYRAPFWSPSHADAILFDWDGVIADTSLDFSEIRQKYYGGRRAMLLEDADELSPDMRAALMRDLREVEMRGARAATPVPGIFKILSWVREHGVPWAVVSRNSKDSILEAARTISVGLPRVVRSRDDGARVKPDPSALIETCDLLGVSPNQTLLIGDYIYDMIGARRAGMRGALVRGELEPDWADWLERSYRSMDEMYGDLLAPVEIVPWEYQETVERNGTEFLRFAHSVALLPPQEATSDMGCWLTRAASLGVGTFVIPRREFSPAMWKRNQTLDAACMGLGLPDALRCFLASRFPFASVVEADDVRGAVSPPEDPDHIEGFLLGIMGRSDYAG